MSTPRTTDADSRAITVAWLTLSGITVLSWWLAPGHPGGGDQASPSIVITIAAILLAFLKCRVIIRYFMEVRSAPRWLRFCTDGWLVLLWVVVLAIYLW